MDQRRDTYIMTEAQWAQLIEQTSQSTNMSPDAIRQATGQSLGLSNAQENQFKLKAEEILSIQQMNSKGFQVVDVNPQAITRSDGFCVYQADVLKNVVGGDTALSSAFTGYYETSDLGMNVPLPYWRSIFIPLNGNFVKFEYMQSRLNSAIDGALLFSGQDNVQNQTEPKNTNEKALWKTYLYANKVSSDRVVLVDFGQATNSPLIFKNGDSAKGYFSGIWVTFKQNSPRFRITVGYNSEIISHNHKPRNLHLWSGDGFLNNPQIAPIPFCITNRDIVGTVATPSVIQGISIPLATQIITDFCLVANPANDPAPSPQNDPHYGMGLMFITGLSGMVHEATKSNNDKHIVDFQLYIGKLGDSRNYFVDPVGWLPAQGQLLYHRIASITANCTNGTPFYARSSFTEPLRVCLPADTGLFIRIVRAEDNPNLSAALYMKFDVHGYSYGSLIDGGPGRGFGTFSNAPYRIMSKLSENPYPTDLDNLRMPSFF